MSGSNRPSPRLNGAMTGLAEDCLVPDASSERAKGNDSLSAPSTDSVRTSLSTLPCKPIDEKAMIASYQCFNGMGFTHGDGMINGLGLTRVSGSSRNETIRTLRFKGRGLSNGGLEDQIDGMRLARSLINGFSTGRKSEITLPKKGIRRKTRKKRSMIQVLIEKSQDSIDEFISRAESSENNNVHDNEGSDS